MLHETDEMTVSLRRALEPEALESLELSNQVTTMLLPPDVSGIPWENLSLGPSGMDVLFCPPYTAPLTLRKTPYVVGTRSVNEMQAGAFVIR